MQLAFGRIQTAMIKKGYSFFSTGNYNLNLVGVRSSDTHANTFNDALCVLFYTDGRPHLLTFDATTDPGLYWRMNPENVKGTAIVVPDQYRGLWQIGLHQGTYSALVQRREIAVYRDSNRDGHIDLDGVPVDVGYFGINGHRASPHGTSSHVDKWSAGCQVLADVNEFELLMALCRISARLYGNNFTYTLLEEQDLML